MFKQEEKCQKCGRRDCDGESNPDGDCDESLIDAELFGDDTELEEDY